MPEFGFQRPIWVHFDTFTGLETAGIADKKQLSATIPGVSPTQRTYLVDSVVVRVLNAAAGGVGDFSVQLLFYGNSTYGDATLANDRFQGWLSLAAGTDGTVFTTNLTTLGDHSVSMIYKDEDLSATRKVYLEALIPAGGAASLDTADSWKISVCLIPL